MCRNIRTLFNFTPPATEQEAREAALQYVRKLAGTRRPSKANAQAFERAVEAVSQATLRLLGELVASAPPRTREQRAAAAQRAWQRRSARAKL